MKHALSVGLAVGCLVSFTAVASAQDVSIEFKDGLVTLSAHAASPAAILAAWSASGHTEIVNGSRVTGAPLTLELKGVPERTALETLLRSVSGFLAASRTASAPGTSRYATVWVMATPVNTAIALPPPSQQPFPTVPVAGGPGLEGAVPIQVPNRDMEDLMSGSQMIRPMPVPPYPGNPAGMQGMTPQNMFQPQQGAATPGTIIAPPPVQPGQIQMPPGQQLMPGQPIMPGQVIQPPPQPGQSLFTPTKPPGQR